MKLQWGLGAVIAVAGLTCYLVEREAQALVRGEIAALREQLRELAALKRQNLELARMTAEVETLKREATALPALRDEMGRLQAELKKRAAPTVPLPADTSGQVFDIGKLDRRPSARRQVRPE